MGHDTVHQPPAYTEPSVTADGFAVSAPTGDPPSRRRPCGSLELLSVGMRNVGFEAEMLPLGHEVVSTENESGAFRIPDPQVIPCPAFAPAQVGAATGSGDVPVAPLMG